MRELLSVEETKAYIGGQLTPKIKEWAQEAEARAKQLRLSITFQCEQAVQRQRGERDALRKKQEERWQIEEKARASRTPRGIRGLWGWITGKNRKIREINEAEIRQTKTRDQIEKHALIRQHIAERRRLQRTADRVRKHQQDTLYGLAADMALAITMGRVPETAVRKQDDAKRRKDRGKARGRGPDYEPSQ